MDNEIRAALEQIISLDGKLCARGTRLLRAVASEAEDALALLPAAGEPEPAITDPSRDILLRADPSATGGVLPAAGRQAAAILRCLGGFQGHPDWRNGGVPLRARAGRDAQSQAGTG